MADETKPGGTRRVAEAAEVAYVAPEVTIEPELNAALRPEQREVLAKVISMVRDEAIGHVMPLTHIHVYRFVDPEEGIEEVVVSTTLDSSYDIAMTFWGIIADVIDRLVAEQPKDLVDFVNRTIVTDVRWNVEGDDF